MKKNKKKLLSKSKDVIVFGIGRFGKQIIESLAYLPKYRVIAVDINPNNLKGLPKNVNELIVGDCTNEQLIEELGVTNEDIFIIAIGGNIQSSLLAAVVLRREFPNARIIAKAVNDEHEAILRQLSIKEIINPEKAGAKRAVIKILNPLLESGKSGEIGNIQELEGGMSIVKLLVPKNYANKKVKEIALSRDITIILVYRKGKPKVVYGDFVFEEHDEVLILAENKDILNYVSQNSYK